MTVGKTGKVTIDFLVDGGFYKGEFGLFKVDGMEKLISDPVAFTAEALRRTLSGSALGTVIVSDTTEGAKYHGVLSGEAADWNQGEYQGPRSVSLTPGAQYGWILIPNATFQESDRQINLASDHAPIFSIFQPENGNLFGQRLVAKLITTRSELRIFTTNCPIGTTTTW
ncbi:MAG: hypothetical protein HC767_11665 [Akkermansiaceae bacterium]|nr:hypothetical protein [Akkermansiaceae bacterium]